MMRRGIGRVGRPGLIGTMARTAVITGTATAVSGNVARRQQAKAQAASAAHEVELQQELQQMEQAQPMPAAPAAAPAPAPAAAGQSVVEQLRELAALRDDGILTDDEFAAQKARVLGS